MAVSPKPDHPERLALAAMLPGVRVLIKTNRSVLISLRGTRLQPKLHVHPAVLDEPGALALVATWAHRQHRRTSPDLMQLLRRVQDRLAVTIPIPDSVISLPTLQIPFRLQETLDRIHAQWFADLPKPTIAWARNSRFGRISSIRFGCYLRRNGGCIRMNPRLNRPWVAQVFVDHVIHHELCHHRQARQPPIGRESMHSARFRRWERSFPDHELAMSWQRAALAFLLADSQPPWYAASLPET